METIINSRFRLGIVAVSFRALDMLFLDDVKVAVDRHRSGDWGIKTPEDIEYNNNAVKFGAEIRSDYQDRNQKHFLVVTDRDRTHTIVLLPDEF